MEIETLLDGNRSAEMWEWCEQNFSTDSYHIQQLDVIHVSHSSPRLHKWRWQFDTRDCYDRFRLMWPFRYQINIVYADSGDGVNHQVFKHDRLVPGQTDTWTAWALGISMPFETIRVATQGQWLYSMGDSIPNKFDVRYLRFNSEEDATQFLITWHLV